MTEDYLNSSYDANETESSLPEDFVGMFENVETSDNSISNDDYVGIFEDVEVSDNSVCIVDYVSIFDDVETSGNSILSEDYVDDDWSIDSWLEKSQEVLDSEKRILEEELRLEDEGWINILGENIRIVPGDTIRFTENVYNWKSKTEIEFVGCRTNIVSIIKETYSEQLQHRIYFKVIESCGDEPRSVGKETYKLLSTLRNCHELRRKRIDEQKREQAIVDSKQLYDKAHKLFEDILAGKVKPKRSKKKKCEDNQSKYKPSKEEQWWIDKGWHQDVILAPKSDDGLGKWDPEAGWNSISDSDDECFVGDIIRYKDSVFSGRYPKSKFKGTAIVIAEVIKFGRKYCHLHYIKSTGISPYKANFRIKYDRLYYWGEMYRLRWKHDVSRKFKFDKVFGSDKEYLEHIKPDEPENDQNINYNQESEADVQMEDVNEVDVNEVDESPDEENEDTEQMDGGMTIFDRKVREDERGYYKMSGGRNPNPISISNFKLIAESKIVHGSEWYYICTAITGSGQKYNNIRLSRKNFQGAASFKQALSYCSCLEYYGNNRDTTEIQGLLTDQNPPEKSGTDKNGIHWTGSKWAYVEEETVIDKDGVIDDIVYLGTKDSGSGAASILKQPDINDIQLQTIADNLNRFNDGSIVYPVIGWIGYCFLKERLSGKVNKHNPILLCQGEPGSGKSETVTKIIQPIFSIDNSIINIASATAFTFAVDGSQSNMVPFFYDEWKLSVMKRCKIKDMDSMLLSVYGQTTLPRGCTSQKVKRYTFSAPLVIAGEMTLESPSIKHRIIEAFFTPHKSHCGTEYYKRLRDLPLASFGKGLLQHMLGLSDETIHNVFDEQLASVDTALEDRFQENAALARSGLWLIMDYFRANDIDVDGYNEGFAYIDGVIKDTMDVARVTNVDKIINDLSTMSNSPNCSGNWLTYKRHYDIKGNYLDIRIKDTYAIFLKYAKSNSTESEVISKHSFLQQLQSKDYFVSKGTVRIGGTACNGIRLDLDAMPDYIEADFAA